MPRAMFTMLGFQDHTVERTFQLQFAGPVYTLGLAASILGLLVRLIQHISVLCTLQTAPSLSAQLHAASPELWIRTAVVLLHILSRFLLGRDEYILHRGQFSVGLRLLVAAGVLFTQHPRACHYCPALWRHRLLPVHVAAMVIRVPAPWYWCGGAVCWIVAAAVAAADPLSSCSESLPCVLAALQAQASNPLQFLQQLIKATHNSSWLMVIDVGLPGVLLTWWEMKARKVWMQQHMRHAPEAPSAAQSAALSHSMEGAGQQQAEADEGAASIAAAAEPPAGVPSTASAIPPAAAPAAASTAEQQEVQPIDMHEVNPLAGPSTHPTTANIGQPVAPAAAGPPHAAHAADAAGPSLAADSAAAAGAAAQMPVAAAPAAPEQQVEQAQPSHEQHLALHHAQKQEPHQQSQRQPNSNPLLYRSAVSSKVVSCKFSRAPGTRPSDVQRFNDQLASAIHAAALARLCCQPATLSGSSSQQQAEVLVTDTTYFNGCYQVLFNIVLPTWQADMYENHHQLELEQAAQQVLISWPDCNLISIEQAWLTSTSPASDSSDAEYQGITALRTAETASADTAADAAAVDGYAVGPAQSLSTHGMHLTPVVITMPAGAGCAGSSAMPSRTASDESSLAAAAPVCVSAHLCIPHATVRRLLAARCGTVRVLVAPQQPAGELLLDRSFPLQETHAADMDILVGATRDAASEAALAIPFQLQVHDSSNMQHSVQVLTVVVLAQDGMSAICAGMQQLHVLAEYDDRAGADTVAPLHGVLAKLPLLVLPTGAAKELQGLHNTATDAGMSHAEAYAGMLPFLQDFASILICSRQGEGSTASSVLYKEMLCTASACCADHSLFECMQLLQNSVSKLGTAPVQAVGAHSAKAKSSKQASSMSSAGGNRKSTSAGRHAEASGVQDLYADAHPSSAYHFGLRQLLCGFDEPAIEAAYRAYVGGKLQDRDFWSMVMYIVGAVLAGGQLALELLSSDTQGSHVAALVAVLRVLFWVTRATAHGVLWAAGQAPRIGVLQQWRGEILSSGEMIPSWAAMAFLYMGGAWAGGSIAAGHSYRMHAWLFVLYRHLLQPFLSCGVLLSFVLTNMLLQFMLFDPHFGRLHLFGRSGNTTAVLLGILHMAIAAKLACGLRRAFVQQVMSGASRHED